MKHRCELRFRSHWTFTHAWLSRVPLCVTWAFLVLSLSRTPVYTARIWCTRLVYHAVCLFTVQRLVVGLLIAPTHRGMARLSWPGWLVTNMLTVTHQSTNRTRHTEIRCSDHNILLYVLNSTKLQFFIWLLQE